MPDDQNQDDINNRLIKSIKISKPGGPYYPTLNRINTKLTKKYLVDLANQKIRRPLCQMT